MGRALKAREEILGRLAARIAPRDARQAVIFAPSRPRTVHFDEGNHSSTGRDARSASLSSRPRG
eukprot:6515485-Pyramimonas_sp.AAC.1